MDSFLQGIHRWRQHNGSDCFQRIYGYVSACKQESMETIYKFGIACYKKKCKIVCVPEI